MIQIRDPTVPITILSQDQGLVQHIPVVLWVQVIQLFQMCLVHLAKNEIILIFFNMFIVFIILLLVFTFYYYVLS